MDGFGWEGAQKAWHTATALGLAPVFVVPHHAATANDHARAAILMHISSRLDSSHDYSLLLVAQVVRFDLSKASPLMTQFDLSAAVDGVEFQANTVRVVSGDSAESTLLVGGQDTGSSNLYTALVIYISVAAGSAQFNKAGSVVLPSFNGGGVTALSQANALHPGFVLASTNAGVFKCVPLAA